LLRAIKARSSEARALVALGALNQQKGNLDEAIPMFEEAIKVLPGRRVSKGDLERVALAWARLSRPKAIMKWRFQTFEQQVKLPVGLADQRSRGRAFSEHRGPTWRRQERYQEAARSSK